MRVRRGWKSGSWRFIGRTGTYMTVPHCHLGRIGEVRYLARESKCACHAVRAAAAAPGPSQRLEHSSLVPLAHLLPPGFPSAVAWIQAPISTLKLLQVCNTLRPPPSLHSAIVPIASTPRRTRYRKTGPFPSIGAHRIALFGPICGIPRYSLAKKSVPAYCVLQSAYDSSLRKSGTGKASDS